MGRKVSPNMIAALRHADRIIVAIHGTVCDVCEDECYAVSVMLQGSMVDDAWGDRIYSRQHLDAVEAWNAVGQESFRYSAALSRQALEVYLRETHPTLW